MVDTKTLETMDYILTNHNWWKGYCNSATARTIRHRHNKRILTDDTYDKVLAFHGFTKVISWERNQITI